MSTAEQASSKLIAFASFHDNIVTIPTDPEGNAAVSVQPSGSQFTVQSWSITDGQTDPKNMPFVGQVLNMGTTTNPNSPFLSGTFSFHCGRSRSGAVADFWNSNFNSSESTFGHGAGELNFAFIGTLQLEVASVTEMVRATFQNVGFAQVTLAQRTTGGLVKSEDNIRATTR